MDPGGSDINHPDDNEVVETNQCEQNYSDANVADAAPLGAKRSKPATPLQATTYLIEVAARIENVISELKHFAGIFSGDKEHCDTSKSDMNSMLQKLLIPFLTYASQSIIDSAMLLSPIQGVKTLQGKQDAEWKRKVLNENKLKDSRREEQQLIDAFVSNCYLNTEEFWTKRNTKKQSNSTSKRKRPHREVPLKVPAPADPPAPEINTGMTIEQDQTIHHQQTTTANSMSMFAKVTALQQQTELEISEDQKSVMLPLPHNGIQYTKIEALAILTQCSRRQRSNAIKDMVAKKYIPVNKSAIYEMLKVYKENINMGLLHGGIRFEAWPLGRGRPTRGTEQYQPKKKVCETVEVKQPKPKRPKPQVPKEPIVLPFPPKNGSYYLKSEFVELVSPHPSGKHRGDIIKHLIQNNLVGAGKSTLYKMLNDLENDPDFVILNDEWNERGKPPTFNDDEISNLASYIHSNPQSYTSADIHDLLLGIRNKRLIDSGVDPSSFPVKVPKTTVKNYMTMLASKLEILDGSVGDGKKRGGGVFKYDGGRLYLGRFDEDKGDVNGL